MFGQFTHLCEYWYFNIALVFDSRYYYYELLIANLKTFSWNCGNREISNISYFSRSENKSHIACRVGFTVEAMSFRRLIGIYGRKWLDLGRTNYSSENCDCHNTMFHLQKSHNHSAKYIVPICTLSFQYGQSRILRVNSLRKACSHCYLNSLSFLRISLPVKHFHQKASIMSINKVGKCIKNLQLKLLFMQH